MPTRPGIVPVIVATMALTALPASGHAQTPDPARIPLDARLPDDPQVHIGRLQNGLTYYIRANDEPENRAELRLVVNAGSILEDDDQLGLAHFLEHMAFNGSEHFEKQELVEYMESIGMRLGAEVNAGTGFDETTYTLRVPTDSTGALETGILILEDWAHGLTLDPEEIDAERGVVIEEWRLGQGAGARMRDIQYPILFRGSRYAQRLPIGDVEVLETFRPEALRRFYDDWYRPDLMAVVAVGDFDEARVEALIRDHFSGIQPRSEVRAREDFPVPDHEETLFAIATDPEAQGSSVAVYFKQPPRERGTVQEYREGIVSGLFNSMLNQRLSELAQKADPPFIGAASSRGRLNRSKEAYILGASVEDGRVLPGLETVLTEAERVARHGFTEAELERAKTSALRSMERAYEARGTASSASFVGQYVNHFLLGSPMTGIEFRYGLYRRFLPEITLEEVNRLADEWMTAENRVVMVNAPLKEGLATPTEEELLSVFGRVEEKAIEPYAEEVAEDPLLAELPLPGSIVSERVVDTVGVTEWTLSNGATVALKPTDFQDDQILFRAFSPGGSSLVDDEDYLPISNAGSIINGSGLGSFNPIDLRKKLTGKVASANAFISSLEEGLSGSASPADLETLFQLIYLRFTAPRMDSTVLLSAQARAIAGLENRTSSPAAAFSDTLQATMTQHHPRAPLISEAVIRAADLEKSFELYRDRFADAGDFTFVFVGDLDPAVLRPLVERYLAPLPALDRIETYRDVDPKPPRGVIVKSVFKGMEPQSQSVFVFTGPFRDSRVNRATFAAMTSVLESRLRVRVREELGGTYGVGVSGGTEWRPTGEYSVVVNFGSDPERVEELKGVVFEEMETLKREGPGGEDLAAALEGMRRSRETNLESNAYWLGQLISRYQTGEALEDFWGYEDVVASITAEMVREAAQQYLDTNNYVQVTLYPESMR